MMSFCGEKFNERRWNFLVKEKKIMLLRRRTSWDVWLGFVDAIGWKKKDNVMKEKTKIVGFEVW